MRDGIEYGAAQRVELQRKLENLDYDCAKGLDEALVRFRKDHGVAEGEEWRALSELGGYTFSEMFQFELDALAGEQALRYREAAPADVNRRAHGEMLSGLALSGGGIRSATSGRSGSVLTARCRRRPRRFTNPWCLTRASASPSATVASGVGHCATCCARA